MPDPEPREPGDADPPAGQGDGLPPARVPPPPERQQPAFNLGEAWLTLTSAGRAVIVLFWLALFAAAFVGFYLAFVEDDDEGSGVASTVATAPAPATTPTTPVEPLPPPTVTDVTTATDTVIEPIPAPPTPAPPVTDTPDTDSASPTARDYSGSGALDLGIVEVGTQSTLAWTNVGGTEFRLTADDPERTLVSSVDEEGSVALEPGTYRLQVEEGGTWTVEIVPA